MELTLEARARLSTLADHTELGSGFAIAMRDLEIRGAGELLGREQSGHVAAVGFELYVDLLNEAVAELAGGRRIMPRPIRIDARIDAYVPADYVESEALKIDLHRRLALAATEDELRELHASVEDRYGAPPEPVENLFALQEARLKLAELGADYAVFRNGRLTVGPLLLGADDVREIRESVASAVYTNDKRELAMRSDGFRGGLPALAAILDMRRAA
jgi:transcription-repair coupling factor (superfamily II helicase)